ncbi:MAG: radical SAM protein [Candidatus Heimdallarchaeaceae archaeon]
MSDYVFEKQLESGDWFVFNLLNFNYMIINESFRTHRVEDLNGDTKKQLLDLGFLNKLDEQELFLKKLGEWELFLKEKYDTDSDTIILRLLPTLECNFRCYYCYQPDLFQGETRSIKQFMKTEHLTRLFNFLDNEKQHKNIKNLRIEVAGGEVFLNQEIAFEFIAELLKNAIERDIEINFTTNGYNLDFFLEVLSKYNKIRYSITIDGVEDVHNSRRFHSTGRGTFKTIVSNIDRIIRETTHHITIRCNVDNDNINGIPNFLDFLKSQDWFNSERVSLVFRTTSENFYDDDFKYPVGKSLLSRENVIKLIQILKSSEISKLSVDGVIILPIFFKLFWGDIIGEDIVISEDKNIEVVCSANQGFIGLLDYKGDAFMCGYEAAKPCGSIFPELNIDNELIQTWNSVDYIINKFKSKPCIDCKFFFVCNMRQCSYAQFEEYDEERKYCINIERRVADFFKNFGHLL